MFNSKGNVRLYGISTNMYLQKKVVQHGRKLHKILNPNSIKLVEAEISRLSKEFEGLNLDISASSNQIEFNFENL